MDLDQPRTASSGGSSETEPAWTDREVLTRITPLLRQVTELQRAQTLNSPAVEDSYSDYALATAVSGLERVVDSYAGRWSNITDKQRYSLLKVLTFIGSNLIRSDDSEDIDGYWKLIYFLRGYRSQRDQASGDLNALLCRCVVFAAVDVPRRRKFKADLAECLEYFGKPENTSTLLSTKVTRKSTSKAEWQAAREFCESVEALHEALRAHWICTCPTPHDQARFSFQLAPCRGNGSVALILSFRNPNRGMQSDEWHAKDVIFERPSDLPSSFDLTTTSTCTKKELSNGQAAQERPTQSYLDLKRAYLAIIRALFWVIAILPAWNRGAYVYGRLSNLRKDRHELCLQLSDPCATHLKLTLYDDRLGVSSSKRSSSPSPYQSFKAYSLQQLLRASSQPHLQIHKSQTFFPRKERLILAFTLSCAYLHLSGGPWWPYDQSAVDVWFHGESTGAEDIRQPYFTYPVAANKGPIDHKASALNQHMPNLPLLGRLILELATGQPLPDWNSYEHQLGNWIKARKVNWKPIADACQACTGSPLNGGDTLRTNPRRKEQFRNLVVGNLQKVLATYEKYPESLYVEEASQSLQKDFDPTDSSLLERFLNTGPAGLPKYCLHGDTHDRQELKIEGAHGAEKWMRDLNTWVTEAVEHTFLPQLAYDESDSSKLSPKPDAVRIAILDTGANFTRSTASSVYDSRVQGYVSWDSNQNAIVTDLRGEDQDGHGTHTASMLLDSTQGTDCLVLVGQVFKKADEKQNGAATNVSGRTAKAIRYAIDQWRADIITMSFGFADEVPEILEAIQYAKDHALLLASASNSGGNEGIAWPAKCPDVLCIFACTHDGNSYEKNPDPDLDGDINFSVLGDHVAGWKTGGNSKVHRSGTSVATPIAAGIAAIVLSILRHGKDGYLATLEGKKREDALDKYERALQKAKQASGMRAIFKDHLAKKRNAYDYISPWRHVKFGDIVHKNTFLEKIVQTLSK